MSERSCAVFFCSGRSTGTSFGVWAWAMASCGALPFAAGFACCGLVVLGSCERTSSTKLPAANPARKTAARVIRLRMGDTPVARTWDFTNQDLEARCVPAAVFGQLPQKPPLGNRQIYRFIATLYHSVMIGAHFATSWPAVPVPGCMFCEFLDSAL